MHQAFISYSRTDIDKMQQVRGIITALTPPDTVFVDSISIQAGTEWESELANALAESKIVFVVWTQAAKKSDWVKKEINSALALHYTSGYPRIVPLIFSDTALPQELGKFQSIDMREGYADEKRHGKTIPIGLLSMATLIITLIFIINEPHISSAALLVATWIAAISFGALRKCNAPWRPDRSSHVLALFETIRLPRTVATTLLLTTISIAVASALNILIR